jgi:copper transport protein
MPGTAEAHAAVVSSQPEPGQELATAPGVVVLEFSEPLNVALSRASVVDPNDRRFGGNPTGEREIRIPLSTNAPGVYRVEWISVSTLDGHTLRGSFRFGVGVSPGPGAGGELGTSPQGSDLIVAVLRAVEYASLLLVIGMLLIRHLARAARLEWVRPRLRLALGLTLLSGLTVVVGEAVTAAGFASPGAILDYLGTGSSGAARTLRILAEAIAFVAALLGRPQVAMVSLAVAVIALAASGHAAAVSLGLPVDALHLVAAGLWAGGILALATVRPPGGWRGTAGRTILEGFSAVAIPAFLLTVATGVLRGIQELSGLRDLLATSYGQVLSLKVLAVLGMVPLSVLAWRRVLGTPRFEAGLAILVIGAASVLAAFPLPPGRAAAEADEADEARASITALPRRGDLTLGGDAGQVLVGLTVRPATPGTNQVFVYLLPLAGEDAAAGIPATLMVGDDSMETVTCGTTCRRAELDLRGGEVISVEVGNDVGGTASFRLPDLPAPDGSELLRRAQERMNELHSYRQDEVLSAGLGASSRASYAFLVPNSYTATSPDGAKTIVIGDTRYRRPSPRAPWEKQTGGPEPDVSKFIWDYFLPAVAPRTIGSDEVGGVRARLLSFSGSGSIPIWFRLWVDDQGLVRKAEMRAQGHFMDHRYFAFDAPLEIEPPVRA